MIILVTAWMVFNDRSLGVRNPRPSALKVKTVLSWSC